MYEAAFNFDNMKAVMQRAQTMREEAPIMLDTNADDMIEMQTSLTLKHVREVSTILRSIAQVIAPRAPAPPTPSSTRTPILDRRMG